MSSKIKLSSDIIGLDLGMSRTGVARISVVAQIPEVLAPIDMKHSNFEEKVSSIVEQFDACAVVVGLPRGLDGQDTAQTAWVREKAAYLREFLSVPLFLIDEAGTTKQAEAEAHSGQSVDGVAAGILLKDFVGEVTRSRIADVSF